jgi:dipeptidyl aminopeptidase/acylaminoacyl peptidase
MRRILTALLPLLGACSSAPSDSSAGPAESAGPSAPKSKTSLPLAGAVACDDLIQKGEAHFAHLWKLTKDVDQAAEGYWSTDGTRLCYQGMPRGTGCDQIFVIERDGTHKRISDGDGVTTCSYFLPGDQSLLYASTHAWMQDCPQRPDMSKGYVWAVRPEFDIYVQDLATGKERALTTSYGYDAEATISPKGDRMVFTSTRSGDLELWTAKLDGSDLKQVTNTPGYDGGAFYSHDGQWLCFRSTAFTPGKEAEETADYQALLAQWLVRPSHMEIMLIKPDGTGRKQVTSLGAASFGPYFFPGDQQIIFATNKWDKTGQGRDFDLAAVPTQGGEAERLTTFVGFDGFPMFNADGKWLVFCSNRGGSHARETNLFLAQWK